MIWNRHKQHRAKQMEAERALKASVDHLQEVVEQGKEARRIGARLRKIQQENHLGPSIAHVYSGRQP
ncbi:DUF7620 family protein [Isoptericola sp. NPDC055881]